MTTEEKKTPAKKAPAKKTAAKSDAKPAAKTVKASEAAPAPKKDAAPKAKKTAGKTITVRQIGSPIGRTKDQRATLIGLKLNKLHRTSTLEDTPAVRGMINKLPHLVEIVEDAA